MNGQFIINIFNQNSLTHFKLFLIYFLTPSTVSHFIISFLHVDTFFKDELYYITNFVYYNIEDTIYIMIAEMWNKKVPCIIEMEKNDVADDRLPLPLIINLNWNHYIGFYFQEIK
jgi:hypothetical protein